MNLKEYRDLLKTNKIPEEKKKSKYKNKTTIIDGISFDSAKESNRYCELKLLERAGEIINLKRQVPYLLVPKQKGERKVEYIDKEFPWIPEDHIIFISNKQLLNIDILIEDNEKQLLGGSYKKILLSSPWNQNFNAEYNGIVRCDSWDEIYKEVMRIVEAKQQIYELMN